MIKESGIISVIINSNSEELDREFHYRASAEILQRIQPGMRVIVPFGKGNKPLEAYVTGIVSESLFNGLKEVKKIIDEVPSINDKMLKLAVWMKNRYLCSFSDCLKCMVPPGSGVRAERWVELLCSGVEADGKYGCLQVNESESCSGPETKVILKVISTLKGAGSRLEYNELKSKCRISGFAEIIEKLCSENILKIEEKYFSDIREKTIRVAALAMDPDEVREELEDNRIRSIQQIRVLEILMESEIISTSDLWRFAGVSPSVLNTLSKKGYIEFREIEVPRNPLEGRHIAETTPLDPTPQQKRVLDAWKFKLDEGVFYESLLHGVTGSGKTEVYLQLIQHVLEKGKTAIVLVPEISLTPQMMERFLGRFGDKVAILHSRLSMGERYDQWRLIRDDKIKIVLGARSAVFAPLKNLGLLIIDEEHENSYKSEMSPRYHAAEVARERCRLEGAMLILGSATPSVETFYRAKTGNILLGEMTERANRMNMPEVEIVDMRRELEEGNKSIFSTRLLQEIEKNLELGQQTILFLNRRGYSTFVICRKCGFTMRCRHCDVALTYHQNDDRLICHYCGFTVRNPQICPRCSSNYIRYFGAGTQKVEDEIKRLYPESTVIRMDVDTTGFKNSHEMLLGRFRKENVNFLVGTQMIAKGHDFPNVTLVGVLAADSILNLNDFRASEKTFQMLTQVSGRSGRGEKPGRVVIQTYNTDDFSILSACSHDYERFFKNEILIREKLHFPPFIEITSILFSGKNEKTVKDAAFSFKAGLDRAIKSSKEHAGNSAAALAGVLGPARAPLWKIKEKYRWRIIIKNVLDADTLNILRDIRKETSVNWKKKGISISIDINPQSMM